MGQATPCNCQLSLRFWRFVVFSKGEMLGRHLTTLSAPAPPVLHPAHTTPLELLVLIWEGLSMLRGLLTFSF